MVVWTHGGMPSFPFQLSEVFMRFSQFLKVVLLPILFAFSVLQGAQAAQAGAAPADVEVVSGGVGETDQQALREQQGHFSFWLISAAQGSGEYLSGVHVTVTDLRSKQTVVDHTMDGPWLLAALPPGRYAVEAVYRSSDATPEQKVKKATTIRAGTKLRQMLVYFKSAEAVGTED
jgi:hypothetical protein